MSNSVSRACFAGGCFWCLESAYQSLKGVKSVKSGYIGGHVINPGYKEVCSGNTGHAEAVLVEFDPEVISFDILLNVFFTIHDPSTLNRQGADVGTQYRSAIFYLNEEQKQLAEMKISSLLEKGVFTKITTEITNFENFYPAESEHDNYYNLNKNSNSYCSVVIDPKLKKLRKSFADWLTD